jgi:hypothetical protein
LRSATITVLLAMIAIVTSATCATAEPPKLDPGKPIRFEIFPTKPQFAADAPKDRVRKILPPPVIGGRIEGGGTADVTAHDLSSVAGTAKEGGRKAGRQSPGDVGGVGTGESEQGRS